MINHEQFMSVALIEAAKALKNGDVPVGAVIVKDGEIIGKGFNKVEWLKDATAHAEIIAIKTAQKKLNYERLTNCSLYVTLEPCVMCAGAIVLSRIRTLVFGAYDTKAGACLSLFNILSDKRLNHNCEVIAGINEFECSSILKKFFKNLREK